MKPTKVIVHGTIEGAEGRFIIQIDDDLISGLSFVNGRDSIELVHRYAQLGLSLTNLVRTARSGSMVNIA